MQSLSCSIKPPSDLNKKASSFLALGDTDLRLCRFLGLSPGYWLRAQAAHDTGVASAELAEEIELIKPLVIA